MLEGSQALLAGCAVYIALLLAIGAWSRRERSSDSLSDFYLAGRSLGTLVLLFTLFATQYSGNSLSGFPGQTYRVGLTYYMSVTFMVGIVGGYLLFAPRLFRAARQHAFVTPTDFITARFGSRLLDNVVSTILTVTLINFLLAQLMAMGHAFAGLTADQIPYWAGVVGGAAVILIYELMGGMRAVAWTDALQGSVLFVGLLLAAFLVMDVVGSPAAIVSKVSELAPAKTANPSLETCALWLSNFLLLTLGAPLYPQAIQRIFAARKAADLKRALATMAVLPHIAITTVVFIGLAGIALFPDLSASEADQITFRVLTHLVEQRPAAFWPVLVVTIGVLAAIMSTADSCLLSLSSILTKDFYARWRGLDSSQTEGQARFGSLLSVVIMIALAVIALRPVTTLWNLLVIKFEILIQLSPAFVLGTLHSKGERRAFQSRDILLGLVAGLLVALGLYFAGYGRWHGLHAGTVGVAVNYLTVLVSRAATSPKPVAG
ncbi:MAG: sodium:solute symporter family protein [Acidobacteria bacterium]|nr:sodium:solute symporter family protein [Acidobacteriota bacterium]